MRAQDLMTQPVATCHVNDSLNTAAMLMWDHDCGVVVAVHDDGKLASVITDRDICMAAYTQGRPLNEILVNSVMARHVISARPDQEISVIEHLMADHKVHRIPVVDADNKPVGIVSMSDLAIASTRKEGTLKNGTAKIAQTLAAICQRR